MNFWQRPDVDGVAEALLRAEQEDRRHGVTTVHDAGVGMIAGSPGRTNSSPTGASSRRRPGVRGHLFHDVLAGSGDGELSPVEAGIAGSGDDRFRGSLFVVVVSA